MGDQRQQAVHHQLRHRHHLAVHGYTRAPAPVRTASRRSPAIIVPVRTPGFEVGPSYAKLGWHASDTHPLTFTDVQSSRRSSCWASAGRGYQQFLSILDDGRVAIAALALGCIRACLRVVDAVRDAAHLLRRYRLVASRRVAFQIADLDVMAAAAHQLVYAAAAMRDHGVGRTGVQSGGRDRQALRYGVSRHRNTDRYTRYSAATDSWRSIRSHVSIATRRSWRSARHLGGAAAADRPPARAPGGVVDHGQRSVRRATVRLAPTERQRPSWRAQQSSTCAIGSPCCSTTAASSRTASWPTRWLADLPGRRRGHRPWAGRRSSRRSWWPTTPA